MTTHTSIPGAPNVRNPFPIYRGRRQQLSVAEIIRDIQATAELPLEQARTLPPEVYTSDAFFDWEAEHILRGDWQCVAHVSQVPAAGDFLNLDLLGEPVLVIRGKDGVVRTLSRICPHRAMDILPPGCGGPGAGPAETRSGAPGGGHTRILMCPYHAWTFELDGALKGAPEMHQAEGFCRGETALRNFRTEVWNGFVFVNFSGDAEPLAEHFAGMTERTAPWGELADYEVVFEQAWDCEFNWKVLFENFSECYHHIGAHARTLQPLMPAKECWTEQENAAFIQEHLPLKASVFAQLETAIAAGGEFPLLPTHGEESRAEWGLFCAPPCFMLFPGPNQVAWYRIEPLTTDRSRLTTSILVPKSYRALPQFEACLATASAALVDFHSEDMDICAAVQRGYYGSGFQRGRMSHLEMPIWLIHRYLAARTRGTRPTLDRPAAVSQNGRLGALPAC